MSSVSREVSLACRCMDTSFFHSISFHHIESPLVLEVDTQCWGAEAGISLGLVSRKPSQRVQLNDYFKDKVENSRKRNSERLLASTE